MTLRVLPAAQDELDDAIAFHERRQAGLGDDLRARVAVRYGRITGTPRMYAEVDPPVPGREVREAPVGRFPDTVVYEVRPAELVVVAVAHTSSRPGYWRQRLP